MNAVLLRGKAHFVSGVTCSADPYQSVHWQAEDLADIGVGMDVKALDSDTFIAYASHPEEDRYEICITTTFPAPAPYGDWIWRHCLSPGSPSDGYLWNYADYRNPNFDELYLSYISETDVAKKKEKAYGLQRFIAEDLPYIFICAPDYMFAYRPEQFEGWVIEPGGGSTWFNGWSYYELHLK